MRLAEGSEAAIGDRRSAGEGRRAKGEGRRAKGEGRRAKGEGLAHSFDTRTVGARTRGMARTGLITRGYSAADTRRPRAAASRPKAAKDGLP
ncbi:hypothetical protein BURPS1710A_1587 [Burkholderia pseudomallei 1710a]|uniref:Uncharacterized protein n=1 Tax=Burkholderia pseudomallei 1710a TaxID=320371 RepID=A0A0E1WAX8_BURPE|nr:hypothetical protein BURPS1710A_1587 [Burkholderia pseudomallei 1710a]